MPLPLFLSLPLLLPAFHPFSPFLCLYFSFYSPCALPSSYLLPPPIRVFPSLQSTADGPSAVDICISIGWLKIYNYAAPVGKNREKNFSTRPSSPRPRLAFFRATLPRHPFVRDRRIYSRSSSPRPFSSSPDQRWVTFEMPVIKERRILRISVAADFDTGLRIDRVDYHSDIITVGSFDAWIN